MKKLPIFTQLMLLIVLSNACTPVVTIVSPITTALPAPTITPKYVRPTSVPATPTLIPPVNMEVLLDFDMPDSFVNTIVFSPDSRTLITGDLNGEVLVWKRETWEKTTFLPARSTHTADEAANISYWGTLALSPDGNHIVQAFGDNGDVTGWDREGKELFAFSYGARVYSVEISPDGRFLAIGGVKDNILIFDFETQKPAADLPSDHAWVSNLVFSPDGKMLMANYRRPEHLFTIWDTTSWQVTDAFSLGAGIRAPHDVLFSRDGKQLALANVFDPEIQFLDLATRQSTREFHEHNRTSYQIAFSPDESLLASAGDDFTLRLWDVKAGVNFKTIRTIHEAGAVTFSPDGTLIAFSVWGEGIQVWAVIR